MLVDQTWIKLIDFGMAKRLYIDNIGNISLSTSTIVGTVMNMKCLFFVYQLQGDSYYSAEFKL